MEDLLKFINDKKVAKYYPNALCMENPDEISFNRNWLEGTYKSYYMSIEKCQNTAIFPNRCEPEEVIDEWIKSQTFYIIGQKTIVNNDIFEDDRDPSFDDDKGYYPLQKELVSIEYDTIRIQPEGLV